MKNKTENIILFSIFLAIAINFKEYQTIFKPQNNLKSQSHYKNQRQFLIGMAIMFRIKEINLMQPTELKQFLLCVIVFDHGVLKIQCN